MANPTTNYGFVLPTSTDLVTDLPADFDVALQGVDTRLKALQPGTTLGDLAYSSATANTNTRLGIGSNGQILSVSGGVPAWVANDVGDITAVTAGVGISGGGTSGDVTVTNSMATAIDAKGDLVAGTGADAFSRLAVGANNTVLTADSAEATGLKWTTPAAGGYTVIATTTINNTVTTYTYSSLGSYKHIVIIGTGLQSISATTSEIGVQFNGDTAGNYYWSTIGNLAGTATGQAFNGQPRTVIRQPFAFTTDSSNRFGSFIAEIPLYGSSQYKQIQTMSSAFPGGSGYNNLSSGYWNSTSAITSITLFETSSQNFKAGTITVYGVN